MKKASILLVEDDPNLSMVLQDYLEMLDYSTVLAENGVEGLDAYKRGKFDLAILDVMMPKKDGFILAEEIRTEDKNIPIIFLTAKSLKEDRVRGFKTGCDDYITKPFSTEELSLRIEAILRRCQTDLSNGSASDNRSVYKIGIYTFDALNMSLNGNDIERSLTRKETSLLEVLCKNENKLIPRELLLKEVWGDDDYFLGRSMDVFIAKLRKYLNADPSLAITNIHGAGFKLESGK